MRQLPSWVGHLTAAFGSLGVAFFAVFNVLFSDVFTIRAKAGAVAYVAIIYLVWSVILHWFWPGRKAWRWWLLTPAALFALSTAVRDHERYGYIVAVMLGVALGTFGGWWLFRPRTPRPVSRTETTEK